MDFLYGGRYVYTGGRFDIRGLDFFIQGWIFHNRGVCPFAPYFHLNGKTNLDEKKIRKIPQKNRKTIPRPVQGAAGNNVSAQIVLVVFHNFTIGWFENGNWPGKSSNVRSDPVQHKSSFQWGKGGLLAQNPAWQVGNTVWPPLNIQLHIN